MNFIVRLPKILEKLDSIWVVVDGLTKSAHFIPVKVNYNAHQLVKIYVKDIVTLHRASLSIILNHCTQFTSLSFGRNCRRS